MKYAEIGRGSRINFIDFQSHVIYMHIGDISTNGSKWGPMTILKRGFTQASQQREIVLENILGFDKGIPSDWAKCRSGVIENNGARGVLVR